MKKTVIGNVAGFFLLSGLFLSCAVLNPPEDKPISEDLSDLVVTEIHYHPFAVDSDMVNEYEFIELHNKGEKEITLENVEITDGITFEFDNGAKIKPGEYLVLASNAVEFEKRYNFKPYGEFSGKLSNSGERVAFTDNKSQKDFIIIDYKDLAPWPVEADGDGYSMVPISDATFEDYSNGALWRKSFKIHGSPGMHDPGPVYVNEIIAHTDPPQEDAIELYNPNEFAVDVSGWYLTDRKVDPMKFRIPDGSVIDAKGYMVFYATHFGDSSLPYPFGLSENGEDVYLFSDSLGRDYSDGFSFDATDNGVAYGRYINGVGEVKHCALKEPTLGKENSGPMLSDIVITEIMYNPPDGKSEYLEIKNISSQTVPLFDQNNPHNTWKISGFGTQFPLDVSIKSGEVILVTNDTVPEEKLRAAYGNIPDNAKIFSIATGKLSNSGEKISLMAPVKPDSGSDKVFYKEIERVEYDDDGLWSTLADGNGSSLVRKNLDQFADDAGNWKSGPPTPGTDER
ncbi:MAG TPA: lamin tail domain-containing protein [Chitinispirillaceae bacterium]|nr:lamin tail domain-containing protein [Chitinispirillaceae bacterium]